MEGAFAAVSSAEKRSAIVVTPDVKLEGGFIHVAYKIADVAKSRESKKGATTGFRSADIEFVLDGQKFALKPGWVALEAR